MYIFVNYYSKEPGVRNKAQRQASGVSQAVAGQKTMRIPTY